MHTSNRANAVSDRLDYFVRPSSNTAVEDRSRGNALSIANHRVLCSRPDAVLSVNVEDVRGLCVGLMTDPSSGTSGSRALEIAARKYAADGDFARAVEGLCGRFLIILERAGSLTVAGDAACTLPVFYATACNGLILASDPGQVAEAVGASVDPVLKSFCSTTIGGLGINHWPGDLTEFEGVRTLTSNVAIQWKKGTLSIFRLYPRESRNECSVEEAVEECSQILARTAKTIASQDRPVVCYLSGGLDSRLTLAALRDVIDAVTFVTFGGRGNANRDLASVKQLARDLRLRHVEVERDYDLTSLKLDSPIILRSSVSEVGRRFFRKRFRIPPDFGFEPWMLTPIYKRVFPRGRWRGYLDQVFRAWTHRVLYDDVSAKGFDGFDFAYWEHRVPTWQSGVLRSLESYSASPISLFANRSLLHQLLRSPDPSRDGDALQRGIVQTLWPRALDSPIVPNFGRKAAIREVSEATYFDVYGLVTRLSSKTLVTAADQDA